MSELRLPPNAGHLRGNEVVATILDLVTPAEQDSGAQLAYTEGASNEAAPAGAANTSCSGASPFKMGRTYRDGTP